MSKNIAAFFDIDGTIYRDSLLIEHFKMLLKYEYINMMSWESKVKEKFLKWENRTGDYDDYLDELVRTYMEALKNFNKDEMDFVAKRVMELKGDKVYRYTRDRLKYHKGKGHKVIIISGSPDFLVGKLAEKYGVDVCVNSMGSLFTIFFVDLEKVENLEDSLKANTENFSIYFNTMLDNGIVVPPSQFEAHFLSIAHTKKELDRTIEVMEMAFKKIGEKNAK